MPINEETTLSLSFFITVVGVIATALYAYFSDKNNVTKLNERITNINDNVDTISVENDKKFTDMKDDFNKSISEIKVSTKEREDSLDNNLENFKNKYSLEMIELKKNINDERLKITEAFFKRIDEIRDNLKHMAIEVTELATKIIHLEQNKNENSGDTLVKVEIAVLKEQIKNLENKIEYHKNMYENTNKLLTNFLKDGGR